MSQRDLYDLLEHARLRPAMFVHDWSLNDLELICAGYGIALRIHEIDEAGTNFNERFRDWLWQRFEWSTSCGWARAINDHSGPGEQAFQRFFELLAQFKVDQ